METNKPTPEQMQAIFTFANANGRDWKSDLRHCWEAGCYSSYNGTKRCDLLQQIRNSFGPSWLVNFSLKKAVAELEAAQGRAQLLDESAEFAIERRNA